jgi:hypothetical protein
MSSTRRGRMGRRVATVAAATMVVTVLALPTSPATAVHQYCGKDAIGVHLGGYPGSTKDNGHPDGDGEDSGWAGGGAQEIAARVALAIERVDAGLEMSSELYEAIASNGGTEGVKLGFAIAGLATGIAVVAADAAVLNLDQRVAEVDACNGVLAGDTIDLLFVARMQEELATFNPTDGTVEVPSNLFLLPDDGSPEWTSDSTLYSHLPGHDDLPIPYIDGMANTEAIGVATVVRNAIAHLEAHGIGTGGGYEWVPGVGLQYQDGAKDLWWDGIRLLEDGRLRLAHAKFAEAYRMAVAPQTNS